MQLAENIIAATSNVVVTEREPAMLQASEFIERRKENIRMVRAKFKFDSAVRLSEILKNDCGVSVSQSSISRYENEDGPAPSLEYIVGLHLLTGVEIEVLAGVRDWGNGPFTQTDPQVQEIMRMVSNVSSEARNYIEVSVNGVYEYERHVLGSAATD